ncbi:MAG: YdcH family protein [Sphingobium sp.]
MENSHISALQAKHNALKAKIRTELNRPMPDAVQLAHLKKQKLRLKEELLSI